MAIANSGLMLDDKSYSATHVKAKPLFVNRIWHCIIFASAVQACVAVRGAPPPEQSVSTAPGFNMDSNRQHWAFQPIKRPEPPALPRSRGPIINPIDRFILAKLETNGLSFSPQASSEALIRRVT